MKENDNFFNQLQLSLSKLKRRTTTKKTSNQERKYPTLCTNLLIFFLIWTYFQFSNASYIIKSYGYRIHYDTKKKEQNIIEHRANNICRLAYIYISKQNREADNILGWPTYIFLRFYRIIYECHSNMIKYRQKYN